MCCALANLVKYVLFLTNLFFVLAGLALVAVGVTLLVQLADILAVIPINANAIPITIIVLGVVIFAIAFCGCCGAIKESKCLLIMYTVCMGALAGGKIYLTIVIFRGLDTIQRTVEGWLNDAFAATNTDPFHVLEIAFRCCGTTGPGSYNGNGTLPSSCCRGVPQDTSCSIQNAYTDGCVDILGSYFERFGEAIGGVLIAIIIFELVAVVFSVFLMIYTSNKARRSQY